MTSVGGFIRKSDIEKIAEEGSRIYGRIKARYGTKERGKFLAIDIDSQRTYLGTTSAEALARAKKEYPHKVFYVVKIGYDAAETMAKYFIGKE